MVIISSRTSAGLLITEATSISEEGEGFSESPGIYTDLMTEGWKHTTRAVHEKGGVMDRFRNGWPLAELAPMSDWYSPTGGKGYTDFPRHQPRNH